MWHPEPPTASLGNAAKDKVSAMRANEEGKEGAMMEEVQQEEKDMGEKEEKREKKMDNLSANASLLKIAPQIKKGAKSSTRKCFRELLQEVRPARSTEMPKGYVVG